MFFVVFLFAPPSHIHSTPYKEWKNNRMICNIMYNAYKGLTHLKPLNIIQSCHFEMNISPQITSIPKALERQQQS